MGEKLRSRFLFQGKKYLILPILFSASFFFSACNDPATPSGGGAPSISYVGATGTTGTVGSALVVAPTLLNDAGSPITGCVLSSGSLPTGLSISAPSCVISGTPSLAGTFSVSVIASNSVGNSTPASLSVVIAPIAPTLSYASTTGTTSPLGSTVSIAPTTFDSGGIALTNCAVTTGSLPTGLAVDPSTCVVSGTSASSGSFQLSIVATNSVGSSSPASLTILIITPPALSYINATGTTGSFGSPMSISPTTWNDGGATVSACAVNSGALPSGLTVNSSSCVISGTPLAAGSFNAQIVASNSAGNSPAASVSLTVNPVVPSLSYANGQGSVGFQLNIAPTSLSNGGAQLLSCAVSAGSLPPGLSVSNSTCAISGVPTANGSFTASIVASNSVGSSVAAPLAITILPVAQWVDGNSGSGNSAWLSFTMDSSANLYAYGFLGYGQSNFGNNVTASISTPGQPGPQPLLVKYSAAGLAQWASTVTPISTNVDASGRITSAAVDSQGNIYAIGSLMDGSYSFGNGVTLSEPTPFGGAFIIKYNSSGVAQWAQTITGPSTWPQNFTSVVVDATGNIYAAASLEGVGTYDFGNNLSVVNSYAWNSSSLAVLVKYNSSGVTQSATALNFSILNSMLVDSGNLVAIASPLPEYSSNPFIAELDFSGNPIWESQSTIAAFRTLALDSQGNIYAAGRIEGSATFGNGVSVTPPSGSTGFNLYVCLLAKYNSQGVAQWAQTQTSGTGQSEYWGVTTDSYGNVYAGGDIGTGTFGFGNSVTATNNVSGANAIMVTYSSTGQAQIAEQISTTLQTGYSQFFSLRTGLDGSIYAMAQVNSGTAGFGNGINLTTTFGNSVLVNYK